MTKSYQKSDKKNIASSDRYVEHLQAKTDDNKAIFVEQCPSPVALRSVFQH